MDKVKWKKIIIKDKFQTENGTVHNIQRIYIALCNTETGEYLISPFSDFLNEFAGRKPVTVSLAADIITRFLNYAIFHKNKTIDTLTIQDGIDYLNSITETAQKKTQSEYAHYLTRFYAFLDKKEALKAVPKEELEYSTDQEGHRVLENPFTGRFIEGERKDAELIHNIEPEYLYTFIKTAMDEVPDIAFGVFLQCFGGLRKSEVISLEYKNISITTVGDKRSMQLTLKDKDLREDVSTAFLAHCKRNRIQTVLPAYDGLLWELFEKHKERYKKEGCSAVFVDADGRAMTDAVYYKRFSILKERFIERLRNSDNFDAKSYAVYLSTYKWSTHLCRGMMLQGINPIYIAQLAGHHTLEAQVGYYSHLETFTTAKSYILSQFMKGNNLLKRPSRDVNMGEKVIEKELLGADYYALPKVAKGQGRCTSKNIPYECNHKSCLFCKYFFPENVSEDLLTYYKEENDRNMAFVKKSLQSLIGQIDLRNDAGLQQSALQLSVLLNQKIVLDSYQYKEEKE